jgi:hypothetical protein
MAPNYRNHQGVLAGVVVLLALEAVAPVSTGCGKARKNSQVDVFTAFHDPSRSFRETVDGPFTVKVCGGWFPRTILGKGHAFCAYFRCILIALHIAWTAFRLLSSQQKSHSTLVFFDFLECVALQDWTVGLGISSH